VLSAIAARVLNTRPDLLTRTDKDAKALVQKCRKLLVPKVSAPSAQP
jgi:hypothetical protein